MNNKVDIYTEIERVVKTILAKEDIAILKNATVVSYTAPDAVVLLAGSAVNITIPNKSNVVLVANDRVVCVVLHGDYSNMFVGWKI